MLITRIKVEANHMWWIIRVDLKDKYKEINYHKVSIINIGKIKKIDWKINRICLKSLPKAMKNPLLIVQTHNLFNSQ